MTTRLANIDLSSLTGQTAVDTLNVALAQCGWIEFLNESAYTVELQMGGINIAIPAWYDYPIQVQALSGGIWTPINGAAFPPQITPVLLASTTDTLSTTLLTTLYSTGETPANTTPQPLVRQTFIPNVVNTVPTQADSLVNTGSSGASPIDVIFVNVNGDSENAVTLTNIGQMGLGDRAYPGSLLLGGPGASLVVDGTIESDNGAILSNGSGELTVAQLALAIGTLARISSFVASVTTTPTFFNHGLGAIPDFVVGVPRGTANGTFSVIYDPATMTATQVKLTGSASFAATILCIKF